MVSHRDFLPPAFSISKGADIETLPTNTVNSELASCADVACKSNSEETMFPVFLSEDSQIKNEVLSRGFESIQVEGGDL